MLGKDFRIMLTRYIMPRMDRRNEGSNPNRADTYPGHRLIPGRVSQDVRAELERR